MGISGIGMSSLATVIQAQGHTVSGCDLSLNKKNLRILLKKNTPISIGHCGDICTDSSIDILVYSTAILHHNPNHPELLAAREKNIPTIRRATLLAEIMRTKSSIAITGSHGKTTTTSMLSHIALEDKLDPTIIIGGHLENINLHAHPGSGEYCITEADESDRSLLELPKSISLVNNIDLEHLETYTNLEDVKQTFLQFINTTPFYGKTFLNIDDTNIQSLLPKVTVPYKTYGIEQEAKIQAKNISLHPEYSIFDLYKNNTKIETITLPMPGIHNIYNCLGAISIAQEMNISITSIKKAIASFKGVSQRFTFCGTIPEKNIEVFDDYGHHPKEVEQTLKIAKNRAKKRLVVLFQPHRFSRTKHLWNDFVDVFNNADIDHLIITDIHAASEHPLPNVTSDRLAKDIQKKQAKYLPFNPEFTDIISHINETMQKNDLLLVLGAGKVNQIVKKLIP